MEHLETEFKWDANLPRAFARMRAAVCRTVPKGRLLAPVHLVIRDVYLDTEEGDFCRQKIAFRVRCTDGKWEATFKTRSEIINGKAVRREETLPLPDAKNLTDALQLLNAKKNWKGLCVARLNPLFEIRNRRQTINVFYGEAQAEMAFDKFEIRVAGRRVLMKEVELEHKQGPAADTEKLAQELTRSSGLCYAKISKVKTAVELSKLWGGK